MHIYYKYLKYYCNQSNNPPPRRYISWHKTERGTLYVKVIVVANTIRKSVIGTGCVERLTGKASKQILEIVLTKVGDKLYFWDFS